MKTNRKNIAITLSVISMVLILMCTLLPVFSFWNYRLCMIPFAIIGILLFFASLKERTKTYNIVTACATLILSVIALMLGSSMEGVVISAVLSIYIAILLFLPKTNQATLAITVVTAIVTGFMQIMTICRWFENYDLIVSGAYPEIPLEFADRMIVTGFNELGMGIVISGLICSAFSVLLNSFVQTKEEE